MQWHGHRVTSYFCKVTGGKTRQGICLTKGRGQMDKKKQPAKKEIVGSTVNEVVGLEQIPLLTGLRGS